MALSGLWLKPQKGAPSNEGPRCDPPPLGEGSPGQALPDLIYKIYIITHKEVEDIW